MHQSNKSYSNKISLNSHKSKQSPKSDYKSRPKSHLNKMQMHETEPQLTGEAVDSPVMRQNILTAGIELLRTLESQNCEQERNKAFEERERKKKWIIRGGDGKRNLEFRFEEQFAKNWSRRSTVERGIWRSNREIRRERTKKRIRERFDQKGGERK